MRKLAFSFLLLMAFALAACGESSTTAATPTDTVAPPTATTAPAATNTPSGGGGSSSATIGMGLVNFAGNSATVKVGQTVTFNDPASGGGFHNIVTGSDGKYSAEAGAPAEFTKDGITFSPGDSKTFTFKTAGTYKFTCTIHPNMSATVTVTA
jgi:plastocyanin